MSQGKPILIPVQCNRHDLGERIGLTLLVAHITGTFYQTKLFVHIQPLAPPLGRCVVCLMPVPGSQIVGKAQKSGELKTSQWMARAAPPLSSFLPCLGSRFLSFRGCTVYAHRIFIRFWTIEKKRISQRDWREVVIDGRLFVILDNVSSSPSFMVTWKATFSAQSEKFSTNRIVLLISLLLIIRKILYPMIFKQSISYRLVFMMILFRSRSPKRRHQY